MAGLCEDLCEVCYRDDMFLQGAGPLHRANLLFGAHSPRHEPVHRQYYFAGSQFYDRSCNNERVKEQALDPSLLRTMVGVEYELGVPTCDDARLFVVVKQRRQTQLIADKMALCYVLDGNIYQAPSLLAVFHSRLIKCVRHLHKAFVGLGGMPGITRLASDEAPLSKCGASGASIMHRGRVQSAAVHTEGHLRGGDGIALCKNTVAVHATDS